MTRGEIQDILLPLSRSSSSPSRFKFGRPLARWLALLVCAVAGLWFAYPWLHEQYDGIGHAVLPFPKLGTEEEILVPAKMSAEKKKELWKERKGLVREAFLHAWRGYVDHAWPMDELQSVSGSGTNKWAFLSFFPSSFGCGYS